MSAPPQDSASPFRCVLDCRVSLGECPVWSVAEQVLYFVDINGPALHRYDPVKDTDDAMPMPVSIGCFALRERGGFVLALRDGMWFARDDGTLEAKVADAPYDPAHHRFNDGRCDRQGRFLAGSMNEKRDASSGSLVRLDADGTLTEVLAGMTISNGLAFSPDGRTMYHADTPTRRISAYDYDTASGTPSNRRTLAAFSGEGERPDGGAVDSEGCYWTAFYGGARVLRLSPDGRVLASIAFPAICPTMCAFGGAGLSTLFVTSARQRRAPEEIARYPYSGGVFALDVGVRGLPEPHFAG